MAGRRPGERSGQLRTVERPRARRPEPDDSYAEPYSDSHDGYDDDYDGYDDGSRNGYEAGYDEGDPHHRGPYDIGDIDPEATDATGIVDFGAVMVPVPSAGNVAVEPTANGRMQAVHVSVTEGRLSLSALAAPKSSKLWPELAKEIDASLREGGARVRSFPGEWGRELHATTGAATSVFVGVDGPRWMLYGVATGPTAASAALDLELRRMLRGTIVVRGKSPYPVRTVLPLVLPPHLAPAEDETPAPTNGKVNGRTTNGAVNGTTHAPVEAPETQALPVSAPAPADDRHTSEYTDGEYTDEYAEDGYPQGEYTQNGYVDGYEDDYDDYEDGQGHVERDYADSRGDVVEPPTEFWSSAEVLRGAQDTGPENTDFDDDTTATSAWSIADVADDGGRPPNDAFEARYGRRHHRFPPQVDAPPTSAFEAAAFEAAAFDDTAFDDTAFEDAAFDEAGPEFAEPAVEEPQPGRRRLRELDDEVAFLPEAATEPLSVEPPYEQEHERPAEPSALRGTLDELPVAARRDDFADFLASWYDNAAGRLTRRDDVEGLPVEAVAPLPVAPIPVEPVEEPPETAQFELVAEERPHLDDFAELLARYDLPPEREPEPEPAPPSVADVDPAIRDLLAELPSARELWPDLPPAPEPAPDLVATDPIAPVAPAAAGDASPVDPTGPFPISAFLGDVPPGSYDWRSVIEPQRNEPFPSAGRTGDTGPIPVYEPSTYDIPAGAPAPGNEDTAEHHWQPEDLGTPPPAQPEPRPEPEPVNGHAPPVWSGVDEYEWVSVSELLGEPEPAAGSGGADAEWDTSRSYRVDAHGYEVVERSYDPFGTFGADAPNPYARDYSADAEYRYDRVVPQEAGSYGRSAETGPSPAYVTRRDPTGEPAAPPTGPQPVVDDRDPYRGRY